MITDQENIYARWIRAVFYFADIWWYFSYVVGFEERILCFLQICSDRL